MSQTASKTRKPGHGALAKIMAPAFKGVRERTLNNSANGAGLVGQPSPATRLVLSGPKPTTISNRTADPADRVSNLKK